MDNYIQLILNYIKENNITAKQIEIGCGLANGTISKWKKGKNGARQENILKVINYLGIDIEQKQLTENEQKLLNLYNSLNDDDKIILMSTAINLSKNTEYINVAAKGGDFDKLPDSELIDKDIEKAKRNKIDKL